MEQPLCTALYCPHGACIGHTPQYQVLSVEVVPTHVLGLRVNLLEWCCRRPMDIVKKVEQRTCAACGSKSINHITGFARCRCCGRLVDVRGD
jgi:hypothetical protein